MSNRELMIVLLASTWIVLAFILIQGAFIRSDVNALGENLSRIILMENE